MSPPLRVVYYTSTGVGPTAMLRHLATYAVRAELGSRPPRADADMLWPRGAGRDPVALHIRCVHGRLTSGGHMALVDLVAEETQQDEEHRYYTQDMAELTTADVIIFVVDDQAHRFQRYERNLRRLEEDLSAVNRAPRDVPVVFQIHRLVEDMAEEEATLEVVFTRSGQEPERRRITAVPVADLRQMLVWPRCDHVVAFPRRKRGAKEALDRAIDLYEATLAEKQRASDEAE